MDIVILAGGISTERDVSLVTGTMIYHALQNKGHRLVLLDVYMGY
ncbi:MAG: D-alanine--D-alanine ligase, partial [Lachnospiraceae bacterium]|nr:D-alanine--D-alanine ligase [Lachnospiraceae bacterium]